MVPKIIHFVWMDFKNPLNENPSIPEKYVKNIQRTRELNPDFEVKVWNGKACDDLVSQTYPQYYELYKSFKKPVCKVDFIRLLILYHHGGIYTDCDRICQRSLAGLLEKYSGFSFCYPVNQNDFLIARKNSDFVEHTLNSIGAYDTGSEYINIMINTGPFMLMYANRTYKGSERRSLIENKDVAPCGICSCDQRLLKRCYSYSKYDFNWGTNSQRRLRRIVCSSARQPWLFFVILILLFLFILFRRWKIKVSNI